jgi:hypothetical protein
LLQSQSISGSWRKSVHGDWIKGTTIHEGRSIAGYAYASLLKLDKIQQSSGVSRPNEGEKIKRHDIFYEEAAERLRPFLTIHPPQENARPQESVGFKRSRQIPIDWTYVFSADLVKDYAGIEVDATFKGLGSFLHFRRYFEKLWGLNESTYDEKRDKIFERKPTHIFRLDPETSASLAEPERDAIVLKHPIANRMFSIKLRDRELQEEDFRTYATYLAIWSHVDRIEYSFNEQADASQSLLSSIEILDIAPAIIIRRYREFEDLRQISKDLSESADRLAKEQIVGLLSEIQINHLLSAIMRMKQPLRDLDLGLSRLSDRAANLGYILPLVTGEYKYPDGSSIRLEKGRLYKPYRAEIKWTTEVPRSREFISERRAFGVVVGYRKVRRSWTETVEHREVVEKYGEVKVDLDPWEERELSLAQTEGLTSYRFERAGAEYVTREGVQLWDVMERCERDETFRRGVAVWIPIYEQKLTGGEIVTRYVICKRPFPGYSPVASPAMFIHESLSYRTAWRTSELGELVHSVNMGPGEERTITIEQASEQQVERVQATTSILDLTESDSLELSTEIEKEANASTESSRD